MANPQIEDGHVDIANELVEALCHAYFSPAESKIFWTILRKTYGWHKKTDTISYSQFEEATGLDRRHVGPAIKRLINRNFIICNNAGERIISEYGIQKDYDKWNLTPVLVTTSDTSIGDKLTPVSVPDVPCNLTPVSVPSDTGLGKSDTDSSVTSDTSIGAYKRKKERTKEKTKERETPKTNFENYKNSLRDRFIDVDFDTELEKFDLYWNNGQRVLKNPSLALFNWMTKARQFKQRENSGDGRKKLRTSQQHINPDRSDEELDRANEQFIREHARRDL